LKYAWPEDVWFHVDKHSSAHYYLRLKEGQGIEDIPENVLEDICQMTKESSRDGRKKDNVRVIYTLATNLMKTNDMETGEVGFHNRISVKSFMVQTKKTEVIKRLAKTRVEKKPDLKKELEERKYREKMQLKLEERKKKEEALKLQEERKKEKESKSYSTLMDKSKMKSSFGFEDEDVGGGGQQQDDNEEDSAVAIEKKNSSSLYSDFF